MMSAVWIGWAAIFMSLVIGDYTGGDPVLSMVVGCSCLAVQCGMSAMALECALSMQSTCCPVPVHKQWCAAQREGEIQMISVRQLLWNLVCRISDKSICRIFICIDQESMYAADLQIGEFGIL